MVISNCLLCVVSLENVNSNARFFSNELGLP